MNHENNGMSEWRVWLAAQHEGHDTQVEDYPTTDDNPSSFSPSEAFTMTGTCFKHGEKHKH